MKKHSPLGASAAHRWLNCPGSIRLCASVPKPPSTIYADEGTAAHRLAEICILEQKNTALYIGTKIVANTREFEVSVEMAEAVQVYVSLINEEYKEAGKGSQLFIEEKFSMTDLHPGFWGRNDAMIAQPFGLLRVYDYKHGAGVAVEVDDNPQQMFYAVDPVRKGAYEEVELVIVQPRAVHHAGPVRRCRMPVEDLLRWADEVLVPGAKATEDPNAPLCAGDWCKFCPAMAVCPAQMDKAMEVAESVFQPVPVNPTVPDLLPVDKLKKVLEVAPVVEAWFNACREFTREGLSNGTLAAEDVGYKLVAGRKSRSWRDEVHAEAVLAPVLHENRFAPRKLVSPAQAEKLLGKEEKDVLNDLIQETRGVQLAPLSDKREAISSAETAFKEVNNEAWDEKVY